MGVVIYSIELALEDTGVWTGVQTLVRLRITKSSVRRIVPWKRHIEHANEGPFL